MKEADEDRNSEKRSIVGCGKTNYVSSYSNISSLGLF